MRTFLTVCVIALIGYAVFGFVRTCIYLRRKRKLREDCVNARERLRHLKPDYDLTIARLRRAVDQLHKLDGEYTLRSFTSEGEIDFLRRKSATHAARELHRQLSQLSTSNAEEMTLVPEKKEALQWHLSVAGMTLEQLEQSSSPPLEDLGQIRFNS